LDHALPKSGQWHYEPKYNGWRALIHAPSGTVFNRHGQRLSIQQEFGCALAILRGLHLNNSAEVVEWFDYEGLERRHAIGQGALLVFDYISLAGEGYLHRKQRLAHTLAVHDYQVQPRSDAAYSVRAVGPEEAEALEFYQRLKQLNVQWQCPFYEGVVAKHTDSLYPIQLRSAALEFAGWMKHRWL
jgi:ATP-dependent DNA ligase